MNTQEDYLTSDSSAVGNQPSTDPSSSQLELPEPKPVSSAPRFGISHMLLLTTGFAIFFSLENYFQESEGKTFPLLRSLTIVPTSIGYAITMASPFLLAQIKKRTGRLLIHPGHWLFLYMFFGLTANIASRWLFRRLQGDEGFLSVEDDFIWYLGLLIGTAVFATILAGSISVFVRRSWRWVFIGLAIASFLQALLGVVSLIGIRNLGLGGLFSNASQWGYYFSTFLGAVPFLIAVLLDFKSRTRRDWIHWSAVVSFAFAWVLVPLIWQSYFRFFFSP